MLQFKKLVEVLLCLNSCQIQRLRDFVNSPYFNKNRELTILLDFLLSRHHPPGGKAININVLQKEFRANEAELNKEISSLLELTENFLASEKGSSDSAKRIALLKAYKRLKLSKHFESLANLLRDELEKKPFKDFEHRWLMHEFEEERFEGFDKGLLRVPENSAENVVETLNRFYLTKKLCYIAEAVYRERLLGKTIAEEDKKEILRFIKNHEGENDLYLSLYGNIFRMNMEKSPAKAGVYYHELKKIVFSSQGNIPEEEIRNACGYLQNHCTNLINKGDKKYLREFIEIIQFRIKRRILLTNSLIKPQLFKNIISAAIKLNKIAWARDFARNYERFLPEEFRNDYYNLALGQIFYHEKKYADASRRLALASHNRNDVYFEFTVKKLLLKIGYESKDAQLESYTDAYRKHLERNREKIGENALLLEKFYQHFRCLSREKTTFDEMETLLSQLLTEPEFADKDWLISMANKRLSKLSGKYRNQVTYGT